MAADSGSVVAGLVAAKDRFVAGSSTDYLSTNGNRGKECYTDDMNEDAKEEVRARLNIEDVVGEYVQLKRAGRNFKGLSPFTSEKTPSFFVSPEKQIWHDFSSNRGGDVYSFVMELEGMDFRGALEHLARKAGVDLSQFQSRGNQRIAERKKRLHEAHRLATRYYQANLVRSTRAIDYVRQRGLNKQALEDFLIGYAPDSPQALTDALAKRGFSGQELRDAGLVNRFGGDLFRGRLMVSLMDASGQVIGFTGRIIGEVENAPKYLNTPQTLLYDKGRHIFGLSQAKEAIRGEGFVVVVEGNMDVVASHQAGVKNVVATAGTAMTEHHLRALKRLTGDIRLAFDGDKAGLAATERAIAIAASVDVELSIISLPDSAKDPDELIQDDVQKWRDAIATTRPAPEWVIAQYAEREDLRTAAGKRNFTTASLKLVASLSDDVERQHYEDEIAQTIGSSRQAITAKRQKLADQQGSEKRLKTPAVTEHEPLDNRYAYQDDLLAVALIDGPSQELFGDLDSTKLDGEPRQTLARYFAKHHGQAHHDVPPELHQIETYVKILLLRADTRYAAWSENDRYFETARLIRQVEQEHKKQTRDELTERLRDAEAAGDDDVADELRSQLHNLIKEIARGQR